MRRGELHKPATFRRCPRLAVLCGPETVRWFVGRWRVVPCCQVQATQFFLKSGPNSFVFHHWRLWACFVSLPHRHGRNRECFPKGYGGIFSLQCQVVVALDDWLCLPAKLVSPVHFYVLHTRVENCASKRFNGSNKLGLLDVDRGSGGGDCRHDHRCDQSHHGGQSAGTQ